MASVNAVVLNDLTVPLCEFINNTSRTPWQVVFASEDDNGIRQESLEVQRLEPQSGGAFRAVGKINGRLAVLVFFTARGMASRLHLK